MKRKGNLHEQIYQYDNIYRAYLNARKLKRYKKEVLLFTQNLEENLIILHNELRYMMYKTGKYFEFEVHDPKKRTIFALPFRDRVAQHAINNVVEPMFDKTFIYDSYACRKGKGTIAGMKRLRYFLDKLIRNNKRIYYLKADIEKYYNSIDHEILKQLIKKKIKCKRTLIILDEIIDSNQKTKGIPIGNLTSQLFANIYINQLDHFLKDDLGVKYYVRYMDDFVILHPDKKYLKKILTFVKNFLDDLKLNLNSKTRIDVIDKGIDFLGYRLFPDYTILRKRIYKKNIKKFRKLGRFYKNNEIKAERLNKSISSFLGLCKHCQSYHSRKNVFNQINKSMDNG